MEKTGHQIIEEALAQAEEGNPDNSPFGMFGAAAFAYQSGMAAAYRHALEMIPAPQRSLDNPKEFRQNSSSLSLTI